MIMIDNIEYSETDDEVVITNDNEADNVDIEIELTSDSTTQNLTLKNIPDEILKELIDTFSIDKEINSDEELLLHIPKIEKAFYHYYDTHIFVKTKKQCTAKDFRTFAKIMFQVVPSLGKFDHIFAKIMSQWIEYTRHIPRYGALILCDEGTHVLMVKSLQNYRNSWGFPRGKVELGEDPVQCAVREVYEEIGFDIGNYIKRDLYIEKTCDKKFLRLYLIPNIPKTTKFEILSPMEISTWQWFKISQLSKNGTTPLVSKSCKNIIGEIRRYFMKSKSNQTDKMANNLQQVKKRKNPPKDFPPQSHPPIGLNYNFPPINNFHCSGNFPSGNFAPYNPMPCNFLPNNYPFGNFPENYGWEPNMCSNNFRPDIRPLGNMHRNNYRQNYNIPPQNFPANNMQAHFISSNLRPYNMLPHSIPPQFRPRPLFPTPNIPPRTMNPYHMMPQPRYLQNQFPANFGPRRQSQRIPQMPLVN